MALIGSLQLITIRSTDIVTAGACQVVVELWFAYLSEQYSLKMLFVTLVLRVFVTVCS